MRRRGKSKEMLSSTRSFLKLQELMNLPESPDFSQNLVQKIEEGFAKRIASCEECKVNPAPFSRLGEELVTLAKVLPTEQARDVFWPLVRRFFALTSERYIKSLSKKYGATVFSRTLENWREEMIQEVFTSVFGKKTDDELRKGLR